MSAPSAARLTTRLARAWVRWSVRHALAVVVMTLALIVPLGWYAGSHLGVDTSTADMIAERLDWRQAFIEYREAFPQLDHNLVIVIDAGDADQADQARDELVTRLRSREDLFDEVFAPGADEFFRRHALLFLAPEELHQLSDQLARVQPFLARLSSDPTLAGLFGLLGDGLSRGADAGADEADIAPLLTRIAEVIDSLEQGNPDALSWQAVMRGESESPARRIVTVRPRLDFAQLQPGRDAIAAVRADAAEIQSLLSEPVRVRLTGPVALEYEELASVTRGAKRAGLLAIVMVLVILLFALRSVWLVFAALATLIAGLVATAAFAAVSVGSLNLISIAFAVLYIGLGIDFAIHYALRVREALSGGTPIETALIDSAGDVGASLMLCAVTTSVGFFAFFPTTFRGVSELGLISGVGMYISLLATLTLLPALLRLVPLPVGPSKPRPVGVLQRLVQHRALWPVTAAIATAAVFALPQLEFDSDPLNLRDPGAESVATFHDLLDDPDFAPRTLSVLTPSTQQAALAERLASLPAVSDVRSLDDLVPSQQQQKLAIIDELSWLLGPELVASPVATADPDRSREAVRSLSAALDGRRDDAPAARLKQALSRYDVSDPDSLARLEQALVGTLPARLAALSASLDAGPVTLRELPSALQSRWRSDDGRLRLEVMPAAGLATDAGRERFVDEVRALAPSATGLAVVQTEAGRAVVGAFKQAFLTALVLIAVILFLVLRDWRNTLVVLLPMAGAGALTTAVMVLAGIDFNFANVIALPLLLGIGVDNGIHMVSRWQHLHDDLLGSSTSRAIFYSALTTIASFGNLAFSGHPGSASMGQVLTIGMIATTLATLILIPAMLERRRR